MAKRAVEAATRRSPLARLAESVGEAVGLS